MMTLANKRKDLILSMIPCYPKWISTNEIYDSLDSNGYIEHSKKDKKRTMQRDLEELCRVHPAIDKSTTNKPHNYQIRQDERHPKYQRDGSPFLGIKIIQQQVEELMPPTFVKGFKAELDALEHSTNKQVQLWSGRFGAISREYQPVSAKINFKYFDVIETALLNNKELKLTYQSRDATESKTYNVLPKGVMLRGLDYYLVAEHLERKKDTFFKWNRISHLTLSFHSEKKQVPFDIQTLMNSDSAYFFTGGSEIEVTLRVERKQGKHYIYENHIGKNQTIIDDSDSDYVTLTAQVVNSRSLQTWLMKYSDFIEVISPLELREKIVESVRNAHKLYGL